MIDRATRVAVEIRANLAIIAKPSVIGVPRRVGCLQHDVAPGAVSRRVITDDEGDKDRKPRNSIPVPIQPLQFC